MSEVDDRFVKKGFWIDWSRGSVLGQTLTVDAQTGQLLVALLTILSSIATSQLWNLFAFFYHQYRANGEYADGLFWQQQALLRTLPAPTALMADTLKLSWMWRTKVSRALLRSSIPFSAALFFSIAALAAGVSTSFAIDNSNLQILVDSPHCGRFNYTRMFANTGGSTLLAALDKSVNSYAMNCYQNSSSIPAPCRNTFSNPRIFFSAEAVPCPWDDAMCLAGKTPAWSMDSGLLDLRTHFGLNIQVDDTVKFRRQTTCNVLPIEGHIFFRNESYFSTNGFVGAQTTIEYGAYRDTKPSLRPEATFVQSTALTNHQMAYGSDGIMSFLRPDQSYLGIDPLPEMRREDADVALMAVWLNTISYYEPVDDPLFSAHQETIYVSGGGYPNDTLYESDNVAGVVGCAEQYQFCIPQNGKEDFCTELSGSPLEDYTADFPQLRPLQLRLLQLLRSITRFLHIQDGAAKGNILAEDSRTRFLSQGLPDDQWIKEVVAWESLVWAGYQAVISAAVIGPKVFDKFADEYTEPMTDEGDRELCQSLKMRKSGGFANVSVFALAFITVFAVVLTVCNLLVLRFLIFLSKFRTALAPRIDSWIQDGVFQLQRRAFDAHEQGTWINLDQEIPITFKRQHLKELPTESSSVESMAKGRPFAMKAWLKRSGTTLTEETVVEVDDEEVFKTEKIGRSSKASINTDAPVDMDVERGELHQTKV
ncbi:hypothetical protein EJ02DRAFT_449990 [Clathrospora elynae]|uniref:Uncharacterized protein n=1 Tax=Clathrospora elynae TaxID=706981 RepID=A0A6A5T4B9_9PLEO|nr:hypothetical protein EJ02DRAFT_449990 [Clathrospora elynae]